ncbi:MAG: zinc-regulated TonB-dependent outer membrane receptor [Myxococcales bacterium]|nr:zinc-regulated TonB-dependent outer membrane receptor [Myxococcales bacterium]
MPKMNPDLSIILTAGLGWFSSAEHLEQSEHGIGDNGFAVQGVELAATANVDPYFRFDLYFQLTEAVIEEAFLTTLSLPLSLQARAGIMNAIFGRFNPRHLHQWTFVNPPLSHVRFMGEAHFRGAGAELSWLLPLPWYLTLAAQALMPSEEISFMSSTFGVIENSEAGRLESPADLVFVGRMENFFELSANWSLLWGVSSALGRVWNPEAPELTGRAALFGTDLYLKWRPISSGEGDLALSLTLEAMLRRAPDRDSALWDHGGYAQLDAQLDRRWMVGLRLENVDDLRMGDAAPAGGGWAWRGGLVATFMPTHFSKLRLQADIGRERGGETGFAVFLQAEVSAGEHGAHKF